MKQGQPPVFWSLRRWNVLFVSTSSRRVNANYSRSVGVSLLKRNKAFFLISQAIAQQLACIASDSALNLRQLRVITGYYWAPGALCPCPGYRFNVSGAFVLLREMCVDVRAASSLFKASRRRLAAGTRHTRDWAHNTVHIFVGARRRWVQGHRNVEGRQENILRWTRQCHTQGLLQ